MNNTNAACKQYCAQVRGWLPCSRKLKKQIMERLGSSVSAFLEQEPNADYDRLVEQFGTPQEIAAAYVDEMGTAELLRDLRIRRKVVSIVAGVMAAVLAIWIVAVAWAVVREINSSNNTVEVGPVVEEAQ